MKDQNVVLRICNAYILTPNPNNASYNNPNFVRKDLSFFVHQQILHQDVKVTLVGFDDVLNAFQAVIVNSEGENLSHQLLMNGFAKIIAGDALVKQMKSLTPKDI